MSSCCNQLERLCVRSSDSPPCRPRGRPRRTSVRVRGHQASVMFSACRKQVLHSLLHILPTDKDGPACSLPPFLLHCQAPHLLEVADGGNDQLRAYVFLGRRKGGRGGEEVLYTVLGKREGRKRTGINIILWCRTRTERTRTSFRPFIRRRQGGREGRTRTETRSVGRRRKETRH